MSIENYAYKRGTLRDTLLLPAFRAGYDDGWRMLPFRYPKPVPGDEYCDAEWSYERGRHFAAYLRSEGYRVQIPVILGGEVFWRTLREARRAFETGAIV